MQEGRMRKRRLPPSGSRGTPPPPQLLNRRKSQTSLGMQVAQVCAVAICAAAITVGFLRFFYPSIARTLRPDLFPPSDEESGNTTLGGWRLPNAATLAAFHSDHCNIERRFVEELSPVQFEAEFRFKKPVILTFRNGVKDWTNPDLWTLPRLKATYGKWSLLSGNSLEIVRLGGRGEHASLFSDFVDQIMNSADPTGEQYYVFDRGFIRQSDLPRSLKLPSYLAVQEDRDDSFFFLGASGSGVTFHKHADAWNGVVFGRKRWFLYPVEKTPPGGVYPGYTQLDWYRKVYPLLTEADKPLECIQEAGEILYLPESTYHATINLGDTIAVGMQRQQATQPVEKLFYRDFALTTELQASPSPEKHMEQLEVHKKLLQLLPGSAEVKAKAGGKLMEIGRLEEALKFTQEAVALDPHFVLALLNQAKILAKLGRKTEAEKIYQDVMKNKNGQLWDVYAEYGTFLSNENRHQEAAALFKKGTELRPDMMPFWYHLKQAQEAMGDTAGAALSQQHMDSLRKEKA